MLRRMRWFVLLGALPGCASMFLHGGELVKRKYRPNVQVAYRTEGTVPAGVTYYLVRTEEGRDAVFEQSSDGSGSVITNQWMEGEEQHFFCWVGSSHGYEWVIPTDRKKSGRKYVYPAGLYSVKREGAVEKPDVAAKLDPVATLIPK